MISKHIPMDLHTVTNKKRAAVLVPLCNKHGEASLLFTVRTHHVSTHKGQVSFPGGHIDDGETAVEAAIREAKEELGDGIGQIKVIGLAQTIIAITGTLVTPVIAYLEEDVGDMQHFTPSAHEVSEVFTRSLDRLAQPGYKTFETYNRQGKEYKVPVFGSDGEHRIWGLTAMILDGVMEQAILPTKPQSSPSSS